MVERAPDSMVAVAERIARAAHRGQTDKAGGPYIAHPAHVAAQVAAEGAGQAAQCVAWLHDVVEDTAATLDDLRAAGLPEEVVEAVDAMTRRPDEDDFAYIERVRANPLATVVKLADLAHNMDLSRLPDIRPRDLERQEKYRRAVEILTREGQREQINGCAL